MNRDELIRRLTATFLEELAEHVRVFNEETLLLEREPTSERRADAIHALFRAAHSLKGAARAVNAGQIANIAHQLEDLLMRVRDGRRGLSPELFAAMFAAADGFARAASQFAADPNANLGFEPLRAQLERELAKPDAPEDTRAVSSLPPPKSNLAPPPAVPQRPVELEASVAVAQGQDVLALATVPEAVHEPVGAAAPVFGSTVRIAHGKLDALLRQGGELLITRKRFGARREELAQIAESLARVQSDWHASGRALRRVDARKRPENGAESGPMLGLPRRVEHWLVETESELSRLTRAVEALSSALREDTKALERVAVPLEAGLHQLRLLPFAQACEGLSRVVRDVSNAQDKQVSLEIMGGETEVDRSLVETLREPLLHLVRNAVDHGIERAPERLREGKKERAEIKIAAVVIGGSLEVTVSDDGRGLDFERIRTRLRERGDDSNYTLEELSRAIFLPGFSTSAAVSDVSGRGVGLDVVKTAIERANGTFSVETSAAGTAFTLLLPLSLSTVRVLLVRAGGETVALPSAAVELLTRVRTSDVHHTGERAFLSHRDAPIPFAVLAQVLGFPDATREDATTFTVVVLRVGGRRAAFLVDELVSEEDIVLAPLGPRLRDLEYAGSASLLASGEVALLLKPQALLSAALDAKSFGLAVAAAAQRESKKRLLLADDSLTTRALERSILESAGYDVVVAVDGASAWQLLQERGADLVLSDVEMPQMDGLSLTQTIRASTRFRDLPVILLTSRESTDDKARGMQAGANAYLIKNAFDQGKLLQTIEQLL